MTYYVNSKINCQNPQGGLMVQRQQLRLVFSSGTTTCSKRRTMLRASYSTRSTSSKPKESSFLRTMRELERESPSHIALLERLANEALIVARMGMPQLEL